MYAVAINVAPIFILILIGWMTVKVKMFKAEASDVLSDFVFKVAVPTLIFRTLATADFHGASPFKLWITYFFGVAITWAAGQLITRHVFKQDLRISVIAGISSAFANNIFIGLPLVGRSIGSDGIVAISILLVVHLPIMMIAGTILMENATHKVTGGEKRSAFAVLKQVGRNLAQNPLVIALVLGLSFNMTGFAMPDVVTTVIDQIAGMAGPAALISLGMALTKYPIRGNLRIAMTITALKLILMPACVWLMAHALGLSPAWTAALVLTSCVPTGINSWLLANRFGIGHSIAASTISISTLFGVLTVSFWAWLLS
ncbi:MULTISPECIES: AEC family transporter [unclassified Rhizobium]|uniref:AEC family transporter n=1 Tax=unclassified Rhizobium TaxID=2613769 RepID=UPI00177CE7AD|nr:MULTISPECIES: AEC family transporter [unclassified Rhizobium]MBD8686334.1 AEC family transporter [Rhizobium sp. CFBP 13644]MBD8689993.1 AEC family transporter [Rhizobium sp. CFBP 13717]